MRHYFNRPIFVLIIASLIITACGGGGSSDGWQQLREQANELYNKQRFDEALPIYEQALCKADTDGRLKLRQDIIDCHLAVGHDHEARQMMLALMQDAASQGNRYVEAETKFALGEQLCQAGDKAAGYPYMHEAVGLMSLCKDSDALYTLTFYHYRLMKRAAVVKDMVTSPSPSRFSSFDTAVNQGRLYAKPEVTRDVLVELMGTDSTTFSRIIREQSGCQNLNDYLNRKRIALACQLMQQHPNWTVETIAQDCGFQTVRTFNRVFKSAMNMTPTQYLDSLEKPSNTGD